MISLVHLRLNCSFILFVSFHKLLIVYILLIGRFTCQSETVLFDWIGFLILVMHRR